MKNKLLVVVTACLLLSPIIMSAQAPSLGAAADFVIFSANGAIGNTGTSQLTGNVGTNLGAITGFGNVNGVMHGPDGATAAAAASLTTAYNQLNTTTATMFPAPALGNGDTLKAGVYQVAGNATLGGDLYLNAEGNPNAVFILKLQAALSVANGAKIKLLNGAVACNVFWKVEGLVSVASNAFLRGNFIANNAAINLNTNDTLEGRAFSTAGAINISGTMAYTPSGCGSPVLTGPACPTLNSAANYAIFSGNGSVINGGVSYVTGDIGTNVGLTTGFVPLLVNGMVHTIPDGSTAACAPDVLGAYNYLTNLPVDIELLYPAQFGGGLVLTPHVYLLNAGTPINGTIYLDARNVPGAVFVFKINGAMTTSTFAKVKLMNGAEAKNVFFRVDGAVTIDNFSLINGNIICYGALNLNTGDTINGRALTVTGAVSTAAVQVNAPTNGGPGCAVLIAPLSLDWLYFRGKAENNTTVIEWSTTKEVNNKFFTLEKSVDGQTFEVVTTLNAAPAGYSTNKYSYTDRSPYMQGFYRISQTDQDGSRNYYTTIQVKMNKNYDVRTVQFARDGQVYVQVSGATVGNGVISLYSIEGKKIAAHPVVFTNESATYKIAQPQQAGMYFLNVESNGEKLYTGKLIVQ